VHPVVLEEVAMTESTSRPNEEPQGKSHIDFLFSTEAQVRSFQASLRPFGYLHQDGPEGPEDGFPFWEVCITYRAWRDRLTEEALIELAALHGGEPFAGATWFDGRDGKTQMLSWEAAS
jgi:hypothetical protein